MVKSCKQFFLHTTIGRCKWASESGRLIETGSLSQFNMQSTLDISAAASTSKHKNKCKKKRNNMDNHVLWLERHYLPLNHVAYNNSVSHILIAIAITTPYCRHFDILSP